MNSLPAAEALGSCRSTESHHLPVELAFRVCEIGRTRVCMRARVRPSIRLIRIVSVLTPELCLPKSILFKIASSESEPAAEISAAA